MAPGNAISKAKWYANRLRAMSAGEIVHRFQELAKKRQAAKQAYGWAHFAGAPDALPRLPLPVDHIRKAKNTLLGDWKAVAEKSAAQSFRFLGIDWPVTSRDAKWHLDPGTGKMWPKEPYCFDIDYRHGGGFGDVKHVWELNRLQYLHPVAALYAATGDKAFAQYCLGEIESWIDANPPFRGVNWNSGIELALRAVSILFVLGAIEDDGIPDALRGKISACLAAHAYWLARYPSRHSSANNHLIAEASALYLIGTLWPQLKGAEGYRLYGRETLIAESSKQILEDGTGAEQSPTYTCFTLEWYLLCLHVAKATGALFPDAMTQRLTRAAEQLYWITDEGGHQPRIGDDDEGRVLYSQLHREERYCTSVLASACAVLDCPQFAPPAAPAHLRATVMGMVTGPSHPPSGLRTFDSGGYSVFRNAIAGHGCMLILDHGPLGYLSIAAHGHADALSVWLHLDGEPVLIDAGTYLYHAGGEWRDYFRGTRAHNTLCIGGADQSRISGALNWSRKARAWRVTPDDGMDTVTARHDGYVRDFGLMHERRAERNDDGYTIIDRLAGKPADPDAPCTARFLVSPGFSVIRQSEREATLGKNGKPIVRIRVEGPAAVIEIDEADMSPAFGEKRTCLALSVTMPAAAFVRDGLRTRLRIL